ncbi:23S rRNA (pseudouridine(1915)-N(3))-methyltransferase RlmH [Patescibacteria group bacterium]|nr:23S rRNA (pseudouridine(1915)-N(3))-methyltransferase RlmH [Patescibacteria group bacterium]
MLNVTVISVGSIKEDFWRQAINEYIKRLKPYVKLNFIEIPEERFQKVTDRNKIIAIEGAKILKAMPEEATVIAMDRTGIQFNSPEWSKELEEWSKFAKKIVFVIGGPLGLDPEILRKSNILLSMSKMTFTHQMAQVILLEQLYRGSMILNGKQYHY